MVEYIERCFDFICEYWGLSLYFNDFPILEIIDEPDELLSGEFRDDHNGIVINLANLKHLNEDAAKEEAARILTHEMVHYHQSPRWMTRYANTYEYWDNPYEIEAYKREDELLGFLTVL